jgi:uncharacterized protein (DUF427 family)
MVKATWNGEVIAESSKTVVVEGNHYFPRASIKAELKPSKTTSVCPWKGTAEYYTIAAGGKENVDAGWHYTSPKPEAAQLKGHVAFWKGIVVE